MFHSLMCVRVPRTGLETLKLRRAVLDLVGVVFSCIKHAASVGVNKLLGCVRHFQHPYFFFFSSGHELVAHAPKGHQRVCDTHYPTLSILTAPRTATCGPRFDGSAAHHSRHDASCLAMAHCASTVVFFEQDCRYVFRLGFCNFALNLARGLSLTPHNTTPHRDFGMGLPSRSSCCD